MRSGQIPLILAFLAAATPSDATLVNRWSFDEPAGAATAGTMLIDTVSGTPMEVRGNGATFDGDRIVLPGTTNGNLPDASISAYLNLPNGIVSSKASITVEIWAAPITFQPWQLMFDFGRMTIAGDGAGAPGEWTGTTPANAPYSETSDGLALLFNRDTNINTQRQGNRIDGGTPLYLDTNLATTLGTTYHYVVTFTDTPGGGDVAWYRNGTLAASGSVAFNLGDIEDVNNWLGRSQWSVLPCANASYEEVRLYDHPLSPAEVAASYAAGPDATFAPPVLQPDSATLHHGQKVRVAVLANDEPGGNPATVEIVMPPTSGTAVPDASGRILYTHTTDTPASDSFTYRLNSPFGFAVPVTVTLTFANSLRIPNTNLNVPETPPQTTYTTEPAFGSLTFNQPINLATVPGDTQRLFVVQRPGIISVIPSVTAPSPSSTVFLDLPTLLASRGESLPYQSVDRGLMSMAFHPQYAATGYFFVWYSVSVGGQNFYRISRFSVQGGNPNLADATSELVLIQQLEPNGFHLGTDMHFGNDGYLYVSTGDGGGQNDSRRYGQRIDLDFHCAMLRLDVDKLPGNPEPNSHPSVPTDMGVARYSVPADNPFVTANPTVMFNGAAIPAGDVRTEFFAVGIRSPFRFSIDPVTGEIWLGDVGQNAREEINLIVNGGNYGWSWREGNIPGPNSGEAVPGFTSIDPLYEYVIGNGEFQGHSVTGGFVYRGGSLPSLTGAYIFGDYVDGHIWVLRRNGAQVDVERLTGNANQVCFFPDPSNGDVLMVDYQEDRILRLVAGTDTGGYPATLGETGLFADLSDLSPAPGLLPYTPNLAFWSDFAFKRRWFVVPGASDTMIWDRDGAWTFPDGMIWVKHFDLETERGNPATSQRVETRILVKNATGSYGVSYRWNAAQTEATLVPDAGEDFDINIIDGGMPGVQNYRIPSRAECIACHTPQAGHALSFNTRQLNQNETINGFAGNQLSLLQQAGYFSNTPDSPNILPRHFRPDETAFSVEERVRSYLAVNCANCHMAGGTAPPSFDASHHVPLSATGLINGPATNNNGDPANLLVVPGDTTHSVVLNRLALTNGFSRMPPIGSNELDQSAIALLTEWINNSLPTRQSYDDYRLLHFGDTISPEGEPTVDADNDDRTNEEEFLAGTLPLDPTSFLSPDFSIIGGTITLSTNLPANRSAQVRTTTDLVNWSLWDVSGNHGIGATAGPFMISGPVQEDRQFFELLLEER